MLMSVWDAVSGVHRLKSSPTLVGSLGYISSFVSCASVLLSFRVCLLSCRQLRVHSRPMRQYTTVDVEEGVKHLMMRLLRKFWVCELHFEIVGSRLVI